MGNVKKKKIALGLQLLIALFLGGAAGYFLPQFASFYQFLGQAFIRLISMLIIPLVLPLVVVAVAEVLGKNHFPVFLCRNYRNYRPFCLCFLLLRLWSGSKYRTGRCKLGRNRHRGKD